MLGSLAAAVSGTLARALPTLFGGDPPAVRLEVVEDALDLAGPGNGPIPGEPDREEAGDVLAVPPGVAEVTLALSRSRADGPVVAHLRDADGSVLPSLRPGEMYWDDADPDRLVLHLGDRRDRDRIADLLVRYPVIAVLAQLRGTATVHLVLTAADPATLERAGPLALSVLTLTQAAVCADATGTQEDGDFSAEVRVTGLRPSSVAGQPDGLCRLVLSADVQVRTRRLLRTGEGLPIRRISSPGSATSPSRPVVIEVGLDASTGVRLG